MKKIRVLLADDHEIVRQGIRVLVEAEADIQVVGEAGNGRQAVQMTEKLRPQVVVMDLAMPGLNGMEASRQILSVYPETKVLVLSSYNDNEYVHQLTEVGAAGYLLKQTAADDLIKAIRETSKGNAFFSPSVCRRLVDNYRNPGQRDSKGTQKVDLTVREAEVLQLIAEGHLNKQIASELGISIKTVEKHRQQVMDKLDIHSVAGLTRFAISKGIIKSGAMESVTTENDSERSP